MIHQDQSPVDQQSVQQARQLWNNFTQMTKYAVLGMTLLLVGMAFFLI